MNRKEIDKEKKLVRRAKKNSILTEQDVSEMYSIPVATLRGWRYKYKDRPGFSFPFTKAGGRVSYLQSDIEDFFNYKKRNALPEPDEEYIPEMWKRAPKKNSWRD